MTKVILTENCKFKDFTPGEGIIQQISMPEYNDATWLPIRVPGDIHSALYEAGVIRTRFMIQKKINYNGSGNGNGGNGYRSGLMQFTYRMRSVSY